VGLEGVPHELLLSLLVPQLDHLLLGLLQLLLSLLHLASQSTNYLLRTQALILSLQLLQSQS
jgi:hypothetical protein